MTVVTTKLSGSSDACVYLNSTHSMAKSSGTNRLSQDEAPDPDIRFPVTFEHNFTR